jgi:hypothetical protein
MRGKNLTVYDCTFILMLRVWILRMMMSLAVFDLIYLFCSLWMFSVPLLWPSISATR